MAKKLYLVSLGCNKNLVDSEIMLGRLSDYEITQNPNLADVLIVNTCGFINSAKEESISTILEIASKKKDKDSILVVSGCLAQRYKDELVKELKDEVDIFTGVGDYDKIDELILKRENQFSPKTYLQKRQKRIITGSSYHAYIKISEGCNQKCSFCAIPNFKGRLQSRNLDDIVSEVKELVNLGFYDFSFISQDSSSFLRDKQINDGLIKLIDEIDKVDGVRFARILYLYPTTTSNELVKRIIASNKFLNYFDMPIQHINNHMLRIMKRGAARDRIIELLTMMRNSKDSFLRTGVIVGHPGEDEDRFNELYEFLLDFKFDRVSVFAYSREEDTESFKMPSVKISDITKRLKKIEKLTNKNLDDYFKSFKNKEIICQIDGISSEGDMFFGAKMPIWDKDIDGEILINDSDIKNIQIGGIYSCKITDYVDKKLIGCIIDR